MSEDLISKEKAYEVLTDYYHHKTEMQHKALREALDRVPSAEPEIIQCKDCKHNPKDAWFGCPMSHLSETQKPDTAWCWKGEPKDDER